MDTSTQNLTAKLIAAVDASTSTDRTENVWADVFLPNVSHNLRPTEFRAMLSQLAKQGVYKGDGTGEFGRVMIKRGSHK